MNSDTQDAVQLEQLEQAAGWTRGLLYAAAILAFVSALSSFYQFNLVTRAGLGMWDAAEAATSDRRQGVLGVLGFVLFLSTASAFLTWFYRAHRHLAGREGPDTRYASGWTIGGFLVPILNLVRPFQVMKEVWQLSAAAGAGERYRGAPTVAGTGDGAGLVRWWWGLHLAVGLVGNVVLQLSLRHGPSIMDLQVLSAWMVFGYVIEIPGALVAAEVVRRVTAWQGWATEGTGGASAGGREARLVS